jgi:Cu(I)/Ag(I) efflux system membrane fusion protein
VLINKFLSHLKSFYEKLKPHFHKGVHHGSHHAQIAFAGLAGLYWNLSPSNRYRVRLAAFAFAILSLGIVLGRVTNVNRNVKIEASDKALKVETSGVL